MLQGATPHAVRPPQMAHELSIPHNGRNGRFDDFLRDIAELGPAGSGSLFLKPESHPSMPKACGSPGLLVAAEEFLGHQGRRSVLRWEVTRWGWQYLGDYVFRLAGSLTREQFCAQSERVKAAWARLVLESHVPEYVNIRDRIALRKGSHGVLDEDDILTAYTVSEERVAVIQMECVDFKASSTNRVLQEFEAWKASRDLLHQHASATATSSRSNAEINRPVWQWSASSLEQARSVAATINSTRAKATTALVTVAQSVTASTVGLQDKRTWK
ncbi:hypothetical protein FA13DRAFT_709156 [Coprinellus micaceus]|uniref:DUF6697 domain-containing protein n=1 Tax=Coprinellus micaceus TaxID=71717 RepID=A0A4Y7TV52_COPMI|nr:hypothetical protein FA13DRAFT_709156 [Coprinellus micaceus]